MNAHVHAVILAGGVGSRFWPLSRLERPKQFLNVFGERSLLEETVERLRHRLPAERIWILTNRLHEERSRALVPWLPPGNIIGEPLGRNTAAAIGLAALTLRSVDPEAIMVVLPADHWIGDDEEFLCTLERAVSASRGGHLVTLGITPDRPETGYGYIQHEAEETAPGVHAVRTFAEKPNARTAMSFLRSGDFLWNAGIFVWECNTIIDALARWLPESWELLEELEPGDLQNDPERLAEALDTIYPQLRGVSIDVAVMEPASRRPGMVRVVRAAFAWNDVGTWAEVYRMEDKDAAGNAIHGEAILVDSQRVLLRSGQRTVALVGVEDLIVVDTPDALLICRMDRHQDVRDVITRLKEDGLHELL
jgi:mannose-1-phosphate guanylyltransferase